MEEEEMVVVVENTTDDEQLQVEVERQPLDDCSSGPHDVFVLNQYYLHVVYHMSEGVLRLYNSYTMFFFILYKLNDMIIFIYVN